MNVLFVNPAWDAAGVSWRQAQAINKYTQCKARHFRAVPTFYGNNYDIGPENYNRDEFISIIENADILHFCSATHDYKSQHNFGFNWNDMIKGKKIIFHDYNSFLGRWDERAKAKDLWNKRQEIGYSAIFSSIPQAKYIYDGCVYIPDFVDETTLEFTPKNNRDFGNINLGHFPTGGGNNKNTVELRDALKHIKVNEIINGGNLSNVEIIDLKYRCNLGFDCLWRGFHGMTAVENIALGIPTMCAIDNEFKVIFKEYFNTDFTPFIDVKNVEDIKNCLLKYKNNLVELKEYCNYTRKFAEEKWSAKNIANNIVKEYEKL